jgi:hypothetical protein
MKKDISDFKCSKDSDVMDFLIHKALEYDMYHRARTYLCYDDNSVLSAYFSLTSGILSLSDEISMSFRKKLTYGRTNMDYVPAFLIAQIGKDDNCQIKDMGYLLLNEAQKMIVAARHMVAGRIVYLECKSNDKLQKLYEMTGFRYLQMNGRLMQMVKII